MLRLKLARAVGILVPLLAWLVTGAAPAVAHVSLVTSTPADKATLSVVPSTIELVFSGAMEPTGAGVILTAQDGTQQPSKISQPAKHRLIVQPQRPLADGGYSLSWTVRAGDAHPRSGAVGFSVARGDPGAGAAATPAASPTMHRGGHVSESAPHGGNVQHLSSAEWLARAARWISLLGALLGIGVLAFAAGSLTGSIPEVRVAAFWVRRSGLAVVAGTLFETGATASLLHGDWGMGLAPGGLGDALGGPFGIAVLLRIGGGLAMLFGAQLAVSPLLQPAGDGFAIETLPPRGERLAVKAEDADVATHRLNVGRSRIALAGAGVIALSYLFDGHTVTAEPAWLVRIADVAHVFGAGVWVGGVAMMAWVLKRRHRRNLALRAGELAVRFSRVAAVALVVVALAGSALSFAILDSPRQLFTTGFGRLLLLKMLAVAAAASIGGYNHRYVVPDLVRSPTDAYASERLRAAVRVEAWILVGVVAVTAALVGAAT